MRLLIYSAVWFADFDKVSRFVIHALAYLRISLLEDRKNSMNEDNFSDFN